MPKSVDELIAEVNQGLERVKVRRSGQRLVIRGTLPPKPGSGHDRPRQYDISPGFSATPMGVRAVKAVAAEMDGQLQQNTFQWDRWLKPKEKSPQTVGGWIERFKEHYLEKTHSKDPEGNWYRGYWLYLSKLPQDAPLTFSLLESYILESPHRSATRRERSEIAAALGTFAGIDNNFRKLGRGHKEKPLEIPTDEEILAAQDLIPNKNWLWVYRMMATYGLRNHEVFRLDTARMRFEPGVIKVLENTKTGYRLVYPCLSQWWEEWQLWDVNTPRVNFDRHNISIGSQVGVQFKRYEIPFIPYALRHAYAVRTAVMGVDATIAAKWMGHSLKVHTDRYHQWIGEGSLTLAWERMRLEEQKYTKRTQEDLPEVDKLPHRIGGWGFQ